MITLNIDNRNDKYTIELKTKVFAIKATVTKF